MHSSQDISLLAGEICQAALDAEHWPRVLERLAQSFGSSSAYLAKDNFTMTQGALVSFGTDPAYAQQYADYYVTRNVLWQRMIERPADEIMTDRTLMPKSEFRRSEFFNDFLRPQDAEELLISIALKEEDTAMSLILSRPERLGSWQPKQMRMIAALRPHLRRALLANQYIGDLRIVNDVATEALYRLGYGVISVDARGRILFANGAAEALLGERSGLRVEQHRLAAQQSSDTAALRKLIAGAAQEGRDGSIVITREARPSLMVLVMPQRAERDWRIHTPQGAIILVKDLERSAKPCLATFTQYFGLTPAQVALAHEIVRGSGVTAAAMRLGISYATARTHLLQIFQKTGTKRQAELVRLMLEWNEGRAVTESGVRGLLKKRT